MRQYRVIGLGLVAIVALSGSALGQEAPPRPEKQPPLKGPPVRENRAPHVQDQFTDGMKGNGRMGPQIPMRAYADVIGKLRGEQAPESVRLSEEQEQKLGAIEQEFREATRAYAQQVREQKGETPARRPAQVKDGAPPSDAPTERPRREMAQEMMRNGPKPGDYQTRIWAILNEKQQSYVKVELDKVREDLQKRRGEEAMQRRIEQQKGDKGGGGGKPGSAGLPSRPVASDGEVRPMRERAQRLMRRIAQLPEEDRNRLFERLEAEMDRRGIPEAPEADRPPPPKP